MSVIAAWEDAEHTIVRLNFSEYWTLDELHKTGTESILMIRSVKHPVYVISDFSASANFPIGLLWKARDLNRMRPANWEAGITITQDGFAKNLLDLFRHVYLGQRARRIYVVRTHPEALELIDKLKAEKRVG